MTNPFDHNDEPFLVLVDSEKRLSLWPTFATVPNGWHAVYGPAERAACLEFVNATWTDMRPSSLATRASVSGTSKSRG